MTAEPGSATASRNETGSGGRQVSHGCLMIDRDREPDHKVALQGSARLLRNLPKLGLRLRRRISSAYLLSLILILLLRYFKWRYPMLSIDIPCYYIDPQVCRYNTGASLHGRFAPVGHRVKRTSSRRASLGDPVPSSIFNILLDTWSSMHSSRLCCRC